MVDQETKPQVFISYSRKDINFARRLAADLEEAGFAVWWDISDLKGGDDWVRFIPAAIQASQHFVVLLSPDSIQSEWVAKEYSYALRLRKRVIPAMIKPCDVPFALNTINYVDFVNEEYAFAVNKLLVALGSTPLPIAPVTGLKGLVKNLPPVVTRNLFLLIGIAIVVLLLVLYPLLRPSTPIPMPASDTPTTTPTETVSPSETATDMPTSSSTSTATETFTPTISATPTTTPTETQVPANIVLPTVCISPPPNYEISHSVPVRLGPPKSDGMKSDVLQRAPYIELGKCPLIGGQHVTGTPWLMIAYNQTATEFVPLEGGWVQKDLFDLRTSVIIPVITLTSTPTITLTPTITPTFTLTVTPAATETATSTYTPFPTSEP